MRDKTRIAETVVAAMLAVLFVLTGASKLLSLQTVVDRFADWGYPVWFMYLTGLAEVAGAVMLVPFRTRQYGAATIGLIMVGAIATHIRVGEYAMTVVPLLILAVALWLLRERRVPPEESPSEPRIMQEKRKTAIGSRL